MRRSAEGAASGAPTAGEIDDIVLPRVDGDLIGWGGRRRAEQAPPLRPQECLRHRTSTGFRKFKRSLEVSL
jgi:hypothetical protein